MITSLLLDTVASNTSAVTTVVSSTVAPITSHPPLELSTLSLHLIGASSSHYTYMDSLWSLACITRPRILAPWLLCPTPICIPALAGSLSTHLDQWFDQFILSGLSLGFRIGVSASPQALGVIPRNHPSSTQCPDAVSQYITSECAAEQMVGPLPTLVSGHMHFSPIGLVPKGRDSGRWCMIVDLSYPSSWSVNDGISRDPCSLRYASMDDALGFVNRLGRGSLLIKVDLKNAYRMVPVHSQNRHLLGICWEGNCYADMALPFGLRSAPMIFTAVADATGWALSQAGVELFIHYLDDFLFFSPLAPRPANTLQTALNTLRHLGVPVHTRRLRAQPWWSPF